MLNNAINLIVEVHPWPWGAVCGNVFSVQLRFTFSGAFHGGFTWPSQANGACKSTGQVMASGHPVCVGNLSK